MKEGCLEKELIFMPKPAVWLLAVAMHMVCDLLENLGAGVLCSLQNVIRVSYFFLGVWDAMLLVLCWIFGERLREDTFPCSNRVFFAASV